MISRRNFLRHSARAVSGTLSAFGALQLLACRRQPQDNATVGYGPLRQAGPHLALPVGFGYRVLGVSGSTMSDGRPTPSLHDGMAAFALPNGHIRLIRNHEVSAPPSVGAAFTDPRLAYDPLAGGGTTSLEIDPVSREIVRDFASLSGTMRNCAGGPTPWQSWLTCEEHFGDQRQGYQERHGYIFDVPVSAEKDVPAVPLRAMGRFIHEAVAVDPATDIVYETEDQGRAGFYRFVPDGLYDVGQRPDLTRGRLQILAVEDRPQFDTGSGQTPATVLPVRWIDISDPDPPGPIDADAVFAQGWDLGAASFSRGEGCWHESGAIYCVSRMGVTPVRARYGDTVRPRMGATSRSCSNRLGPTSSRVQTTSAQPREARSCFVKMQRAHATFAVLRAEARSSTSLRTLPTIRNLQEPRSARMARRFSLTFKPPDRQSQSGARGKQDRSSGL